MLTIGRELTPQQRLDKCVIDIMGNPKYTALNGVLMVGSRAVCEKQSGPYQTAATNGRDEWYHPKFIESMNDAELRFVILHENYHKMYRHLITWKELHDINHTAANQACDHVINIKIVDDNTDGFAVIPKNINACHDTKYRGWSAAQVFNDLMKDAKEGKSNPSPGTLDSHDWDGAQELTEEEKHALERDIDEAIRQGALAAGKVGANDQINVDELLTPKVNWREVMREFVCQTCTGNDFGTYARLNRRYVSLGIAMPSGVSEQIGELIGATDMSGSTGMGMMRPRFQTEMQNVLDTMFPDKYRQLYWDTEVAGDELYDRHEQADFHKKTKPCGGGGTDAECVPIYIDKNNINAQAVVMLTDGHLFGDWGTWSKPVLWLIVDNPSAVPPVGKCVHINSGDEL